MSITTRAPYGFELEYMPIDAFGGANPHKLNPIAYSLMHKQPTLHGGGGGNVFKAVVAVAAAVAVPYFAPAIASSIGLSGAVSTALAGTFAAGASGAIAGGIVGAALGAVAAKVTGQDAGRGALFGAIGGGISGYQGINSATGALNAPAGTVTGAGAQAPATTGVGGLTPGMSQAEMLAAQEAGFGATQQAQMLAAQDAGLGATLSSGGAETAYGYQAPTAGLSTGTAPTVAGAQGQVQTGAQPGMTQQQAMLAEQQAGFDVPPPSTVSQQQQMLAAQDAAFGVTPTNATTALNYAAPTQTTMGAIGEKLTAAATNAGRQVVKSVTDPKKQADFLLRAAGQIAGTYAAPDGMSDEEKQFKGILSPKAFEDAVAVLKGALGEAKGLLDLSASGLSGQTGATRSTARDVSNILGFQKNPNEVRKLTNAEEQEIISKGGLVSNEMIKAFGYIYRYDLEKKDLINTGAVQKKFAGGKIRGYARGGYITGFGSSVADNIPLLASNKEFMMNAMAVRRYGVPFMESINRLQYNPGTPKRNDMSQSNFGPSSVSVYVNKIDIVEPGADADTIIATMEKKLFASMGRSKDKRYLSI